MMLAELDKIWLIQQLSHPAVLGLSTWTFTSQLVNTLEGSQVYWVSW